MKYGLLAAVAALVFAIAGGYWWLTAVTGQSKTATHTNAGAQAGLSYTQRNSSGGLNGLRGSSREVTEVGS